jgi:hypothetical protein
MNEITDRRSPKLVWGVSGVLGVGLLLAYILPALKEPGDYYDGPSRVSMVELNYFLHLSGNGWILDLAKAGIVTAIVAAFAFPRQDRQTQAVVITIGSLIGLYLPFWIHGKLSGGESLGAGLWILGLACAIAAALPWLLPKLEESQADSVATSSASTVYGPTSAMTPGSRLPFVVRPAAGAPGSPTRAMARNFDAGQTVSIEWIDESGSAQKIAETTASPSGEIDVAITVPANLSPDAYTLRARAANGTRWSSSFTIV